MYLFQWKSATVVWIWTWLTSDFLALASRAQVKPSREEVDPTCPAQSIPGCQCSVPHYHEDLGWIMTCKDVKENLTYTLEHYYSDPKNPSYDSKYILSCTTLQPTGKGFFRQFQSRDGYQTQNFNFQTCPILPNESLTDFFEGQTVQSLSYECDTCRPNTITSQQTFWNLDTLTNLTLNKFNLSELPENILGQLVDLRALVLNYDQISELPENFLFKQSKLETLDLSLNNLEVLPKNLFRNLVNLKTLILNFNRFKEITGETLGSLVSLENLNIGDNKISRLAVNAFESNKNLSRLLLYNNTLQSIQLGTLGNSTSLKYLDLSYNYELSSLPATIGDGIRNLQFIIVSHCNISTIPENFLLNAFNLSHFDISANSIRYLPPNLFRDTTRLKFLSFAFNRFTNFPSGILKNLQQLQDLDLEGNNLTEFGNLPTLPSLFKINLQNNTIRKLVGNGEPFGGESNLSLVDLSHNKLQEFVDLDWQAYSSLQSLDLQYNEITVLDVNIMGWEKIDIHLENNKISLVQVSEIERTESHLPINHGSQEEDYSKHDFYLRDNPLHCDCHMLEFQCFTRKSLKKMTRFHDKQDLVCSSPERLANHSFMDVKEEDFVCQIYDNCPKDCTCILRALNSSTEVNCTNKQLKELPDVVPKNTSVLNFQNNSLTSLSGLRKSQWSNLSVLNVDDNNVTSEGLYFPQNLKFLSVQRNALTVVPTALVDWGQTAELLNLDGNPWRCDCSGLALKQLLTDLYSIIPNRDNVLCATPAFQFNKMISDLQEKDLCPLKKINSSAYITALSVCVPLVIFICVLCVFYYRNRKMIIGYIYIHYYKIFTIFFRESDVDEDKPFHAFVSYSSSDSDVVKVLLEELEKKDPYFRLCVHERDWLPGQLITWNIVMSVQNSRRTILVLSREFLKSVWFQLEFHIAYYQMLEDKMDRLIVVVNGDLPEKQEMDADLQFLLSTKSYLIWKERWFWEKLRYALPHKQKTVHAPSSRTPEVQGPSSDLLQKIEGKIMSLTQDTVRTVPSPSTSDVELELQEVQRNNGDCMVLQNNTSTA